MVWDLPETSLFLSFVWVIFFFSVLGCLACPVGFEGRTFLAKLSERKDIGCFAPENCLFFPTTYVLFPFLMSVLKFKKPAYTNGSH